MAFHQRQLLILTDNCDQGHESEHDGGGHDDHEAFGVQDGRGSLLAVAGCIQDHQAAVEPVHDDLEERLVKRNPAGRGVAHAVLVVSQSHDHDVTALERVDVIFGHHLEYRGPMSRLAIVVLACSEGGQLGARRRGWKFGLLRGVKVDEVA